MTKKRYDESILYTVFDELINADYRLNELLDKIGQLKKENEQLKHDATVLICSNKEYREENEQLKSELKAIREERRKEFEIANGW